MKSCPFCAEDVQDAEAVCHHCGRELPLPPTLPQATPLPGRAKAAFWLVVLGVVALVTLAALWHAIAPTSLTTVGSDAECTLQAHAAIVDRNAPLFDAIGNTSADVLAVRNRDSQPWRDVVVAVYGFQTLGTQRRPTGRYELKVGAIDANKLAAFSLNEFTSRTGTRWVSMTMKVDVVEIRATLLGKACTATIVMGTPKH